MRFGIFFALAAMSLPTLSTAAGTIYKCKDANGGTIFSPTPCGKDAKEVDTSAALKTGTAPNLQGVADRAAIAAIDGQCASRERTINDLADADVRDADREIARLRGEMTISANNGPGAIRDNGIRTQLAAAEDRRAAALHTQRAELNDLRKSCETDRTAELQRQADRDSTATTAKP